MIESVYIHIPFCEKICNYCDFPKMYCLKNWVDKYLIALEKEIKTKYQHETLKTIYIGGGTPSSLSLEQLEYLLNITKLFKLTSDYEFTIECNVEHISTDFLKLLKKYGVNRLSIGVQTFNQNHLKNLNRNADVDNQKQIKLAKKYFTNVSVDLMYALPNQTVVEVKKDLEEIIKLNIPHVSCYSLMIEPHTIFYNNHVEPLNEEIDEEMYKLITTTLKEHDFIHYETSNYSKKGYQSKHNLQYWNNQYYYGFGLGASGYLPGYRYTNTKKISSYLDFKYETKKEIITIKDEMIYEMILGLRKKEGVNEEKFFSKYGQKIDEVFFITDLLKQGKLKKSHGYIKIPEKYIYIANEILLNFV